MLWKTALRSRHIRRIQNISEHTGFLFLSVIVVGALPLFGTPPTFVETREVLPVLSYFQALAVGDMNGDGEPDIVSASSQYSSVSQVEVFFGGVEGAYRLGPVLALPGGFNPSGVAIADFDHDGLADVVVLSTEGLLELFIQQPSGSFVAETVPFMFGFSYARDIVAADLNKDGLPDLILPTNNGTVFLQNNGDAQFQPPVYLNSLPGTFATVADLNKDGNLDVITVSATGTGKPLLVQLGEGNGTFKYPASQPATVGDVASQIAVADFNQDGIADIAFSLNAGQNSTVTVLNGNGDGTFSPGYSSALALNCEGFATADINGDGMPDLVLVESDFVYLAYLLAFENMGEGNFSQPEMYAVQPNAYDLITVTPGPGHHPEAIVVPGEGSFDTVFRSDVNGKFGVLQTFAPIDSPAPVLAGDFNGDGKLDLVGFNSSGIVTYLNTGNNKQLFTALPPHPFEGGVAGATLAVGDFNGDGRLDVAAVYRPYAQFAVQVAATFLGNGNGTFANPATVSYDGSNGNLFGITAADVNGDGKLDLVTSFLSVALGHGDGTFAPAITGKYPCTGTTAPFIADFNGDGKLDMLTVCTVNTNPTVMIYLGNGDGTFQQSPVYSEAFGYLTGLNVGDFNGDGIPDFVTINEPGGSPKLNVMFGVGDGTFLAGPTVLLPVLVVEYPIPGDYNGDGVLGVALVDIYDNVVSVLAGNGDGTFQTPRSFGLELPPSYMLAGTFHAGVKPGEDDLIIGTDDPVMMSPGSGFEVILNATP